MKFSAHKLFLVYCGLQSFFLIGNTSNPYIARVAFKKDVKASGLAVHFLDAGILADTYSSECTDNQKHIISSENKICKEAHRLLKKFNSLSSNNVDI